MVIDYRTPGGMAMDEFPLRTGAYALATSCSSEVGSALSAVAVTADCPGQLVEIKCKSNDVVGAERWDVTAPSEGGLIGQRRCPAWRFPRPISASRCRKSSRTTRNPLAWS